MHDASILSENEKPRAGGNKSRYVPGEAEDISSV